MSKMQEQKNSILKCPNCNAKVRLSEYSNHCKQCGFVFINYVKRMNSKKVEERTTTRRTGDGVDLIDG